MRGLCTVIFAMIVVTLATPVATCHASPLADFERHFLDETLRIDYFHTGNSTEEIISLDQMYRQGSWAGSRTRRVDTLDLGRYYAKVYDAASGELLYSRGFDSYYGEWKTTSLAAEGVRRTYHESALVPFPRAPIEFTLEVRQDDLTLAEIYRVEIDPQSFLIREDSLNENVIVVKAAYGGDSHSRVDVAILGEGYTVDEEEKFRADLARFTKVMLGYEPYSSLAHRFNVWGVLLPSQESGCDEPSRGVHRNTALGSTFDSLGSERYLLTEANRSFRDVAAHVPYDALYIMVNHERYGGGGIYNLFCTFTSDNQWSEYVFLHEFGHHFAGLADEYYISSTAYNDFYPRGVEPHERNITRLLDPDHVKWQHLLTPGIAVPTPWAKVDYDTRDREYQKKRGQVNENIASLMRAGAPGKEVESAKAEGELLSKSHQNKVDDWFAQSSFSGQVGVFEGAGYSSTGMFRSQLDCIMFSKGLKPFCAACRQGIIEVIERYGE
ncbi:MAG: IgA Peptidase M64 [Gemmatimonadales bacterium]|nr:IgA Peptidase M64 [Gemmatimonadales bacterium]